MKFKKNEKLKHMKMFYYYILTKPEDEELEETNVLHFDYDNGTYSITIKDLMKKAKAEVEREKKKQK